jgi:hypothetical protein
MVEAMEDIRDKTGVSVSTQIELRLKGYTITSTPQKGNWDKIWQWYTTTEKNDELADNIEKSMEKTKELKLH